MDTNTSLIEKNITETLPKSSYLLLESQYFPPVQYFVAIANVKKTYIEACENFQKQTYRNRFYILTANGIKKFTVPVIGSNKKPVKDLKIEKSIEWKNIHWRAIKSAYGKAPYFEFFEKPVHDLIYTNFEFLLDLNMEILERFLKLLEIDKQPFYTTVYKKNTDNLDFMDGRDKINPKNPEPLNNYFRNKPYNQIFGYQFEEGLSIIDLLFNEGPNAKKIIMDSYFFDNNN